MTDRASSQLHVSGLGPTGRDGARLFRSNTPDAGPFSEPAARLALLLVDPDAHRGASLRRRVANALDVGLKDVLVVGAHDDGIVTELAALGALPIAVPGSGPAVARLVRSARATIDALLNGDQVEIDVAAFVAKRPLPATAVATTWTTSATSPKLPAKALPPSTAAVVLHIGAPSGARLRTIDRLTRTITSRCPRAAVDVAFTLAPRRRTISCSMLAVVPMPLRQLAYKPGAPDPHHVRGRITGLKRMVTTRKRLMARFRLRCAAESIQVVVFPDAYERLAPMLVSGRVVTCVGMVRNDHREVAMLLQTVVGIGL